MSGYILKRARWIEAGAVLGSWRLCISMGLQLVQVGVAIRWAYPQRVAVGLVLFTINAERDP